MGLFANAASVTRFDPWRISEDEARTVAGPAARILARHANVAEKIALVADPAALVLAAVAITMPRFIMYKMTVEAQKHRGGLRAVPDAPAQQEPAPGPVNEVPQGERTGSTAVNFAERLLNKDGA